MKQCDMALVCALIENPFEDVPIADICNKAGMTRRQAMTRLANIQLPNLIIDREGTYGPYYRLECDPQTIEQIVVTCVSRIYRCPEDKVLDIINSVPNCGYLAIDDVTRMTGAERNIVAYTFRTCPTIKSIKIDSKLYFRKAIS